MSLSMHVFGSDGQLMVTVHARAKVGADPAWAAAWLRNYLEHRPGSPPFFLLATPETLYLWKRPSAETTLEPTAVVDARLVLSGYLGRPGMDPADLSGSTFEFLVQAWLEDLSLQLWQPIAPEEVRALVDTGFVKAVENGRVVSNIAA